MGFINLINSNKFNYKQYNFTEVIDTPDQSPDIYLIENLRFHIKKKVRKRSRTNKNELISFIKGEWKKIPLKYDDILKLIQFIQEKASATGTFNYPIRR